MRHQAELRAGSFRVGQGEDPAVVHHRLQAQYLPVEDLRPVQGLAGQVRNNSTNSRDRDSRRPVTVKARMDVGSCPSDNRSSCGQVLAALSVTGARDSPADPTEVQVAGGGAKYRARKFRPAKLLLSGSAPPPANRGRCRAAPPMPATPRRPRRVPDVRARPGRWRRAHQPLSLGRGGSVRAAR